VIISITTGFEFTDLTYHSTMSIIIAIFFAVVLWVSYVYIIEMLKNEAHEQFKATF